MQPSVCWFLFTVCGSICSSSSGAVFSSVSSSYSGMPFGKQNNDLAYDVAHAGNQTIQAYFIGNALRR